MKAKDYAVKFNNSSESLGKIAMSFINEIGELIKTRNVKTDEGIIAILNELNQKWRTFTRLVNSGVKENGFEIAVKEVMPEVYQFWLKEGIK